MALASEGGTFYNYQEGLAEALTIAMWESGKHKAGVGVRTGIGGDNYGMCR